MKTADTNDVEFDFRLDPNRIRTNAEIQLFADVFYISHEEARRILSRKAEGRKFLLKVSPLVLEELQGKKLKEYNHMKKLIKIATVVVGIGAMTGLTGCGDGKSDKQVTPPKASAKASAPAKAASVTLTVNDLNLNFDMEDIRGAIKEWQKDRWNADVIAKARETSGKVSAADLKMKSQYKELQSTFDLLVDEYVTYVNVIDSFADASSPSEAALNLTKAISLDDVVRMAKNLGQVVDDAKAIKDNASWTDAVTIGKDLVTISAASASMVNASGILKNIFEQITKK